MENIFFIFLNSGKNRKKIAWEKVKNKVSKSYFFHKTVYNCILGFSDCEGGRNYDGLFIRLNIRPNSAEYLAEFSWPFSRIQPNFLMCSAEFSQIFRKVRTTSAEFYWRFLGLQLNSAENRFNFLKNLWLHKSVLVNSLLLKASGSERYCS